MDNWTHLSSFLNTDKQRLEDAVVEGALAHETRHLAQIKV
jgi:hypothetical protein